MLEFVVGAGETGAIFKGIAGEFTALHGGDNGDLLKELLFLRSIHNMTSIIVTQTRKSKLSLLFGKIWSHALVLTLRFFGLATDDKKAEAFLSRTLRKTHEIRRF